MRTTRSIVLAALMLLAAAAAVLHGGTAEAQRKLPGVRVECSSLKDRPVYCRTHAIGRVRLEKQLSKTRCRENVNWGSDGDGSGVWVKDGCRGVFVVERGGRPGPGPGKTITCTSKNYGYTHCNVSTWGREVRVERQISSTRCVQGDNWGVDWRGIWVDRGCNAVFAVR